MGKKTSIEWTDSTWSPWVGCTKISEGCRACYMFRQQEYFGNNPREIRRTSNTTFYRPLKWSGRKVFVCSWSDFFLVEADGWREDAWDVMERASQHTYQILTKRPDNVSSRLPFRWGRGWKNVWLGVSVESPDYYSRIDKLVNIPAVVRFISYEPALEEVDFTPWLKTGKIHWVIAGGESGPKARLPDMSWFRHVRDQCAQYKVAYFYKQFGGDTKDKEDGAWGGRSLDGKYWGVFPKNMI